MAKENKFDVAVIGGGPAGMMAAGRAAASGAKVILIEKNQQLGQKLLLTGHGRCNLTNAEFNLKELVKNYYHGDFLFHGFFIFGPKEVIKFFADLGIKTKIVPAEPRILDGRAIGKKSLPAQAGKRVFPVSDDAREILSALNKYLTKNKVEMLFKAEVIDIDYQDNAIKRLILKDREIIAKKYILCTGGKSCPLTGSNGLGYKLAEKLGQTIIKPRPALSSIKVKDEWIKNLQGVSLENIKISVCQKGKKQFSEEGDILFTHFGLSGPAILNISGQAGELLEKSETKIILDLFPLLKQAELIKKLDEIFKKYPKKAIKNALANLAPERLVEVLLGMAGIDRNKMANGISKIEKEKAVKLFKNFELTVESVLGFAEAKATRGGVSLKEIDPKTMKSKIIDNLFFAGEIIDVDGKSGGFNLQMCWTTGYLAGESCLDISGDF